MFPHYKTANVESTAPMGTGRLTLLGLAGRCYVGRSAFREMFNRLIEGYLVKHILALVIKVISFLIFTRPALHKWGAHLGRGLGERSPLSHREVFFVFDAFAQGV